MAELTAVSYAYRDGEVVQEGSTYASWIVVSQDCDLAAVDSDSAEPLIEIMPVQEGSDGGWGIRSRTLRLGDDLRTDARLPKLRISPAALSAFVGSLVEALPVERVVALKTWLGLRYDRPAVPEVLVGLARAIATAVKATRTPELADVTHDVLFFATEEIPSSFELIGVITDAAHASAVVEWLVRAALQVDPALGTLAGPPAAVTKAELSVADVENSYSADLSDISWSKRQQRGAV